MHEKRRSMLEVRGYQENSISVNQRPLTWLGQRCKRLVVGARGFEPPTSCTPCKRASRSALRPDKFFSPSGLIIAHLCISGNPFV